LLGFGYQQSSWAMQFRKHFISAHKPRVFRRSEHKRRFPSSAVLLASWTLVLSFVLTEPVFGQDLPGGFDWPNAEFTTYARGSVREIADCKVERVFTGHRKVGFFRVRLLPVLVVQGVRLEFTDAAFSADWARGFRPDWLPLVKRGDVEWRDVTVTFKKGNAPRLHANQAFPRTGGGATICEFKDVTLEAGGKTWQLPRAELRDEDGLPFAVWRSGGAERRMDLISGKITDNKQ
jgi:hypothetical protein